MINHGLRLRSKINNSQAVAHLHKQDVPENKSEEMLQISNADSKKKLKYGDEFKLLLDARDQVLEHQFHFTFNLND